MIIAQVIGFDVGEWVDKINHLPPAVLAIIGVLLIGFALKRAAAFPNKYIPLLLMFVVGPGLFTMAEYGNLLFALKGMVCAGLVWLFHAQIWKRFADKFLPKDSQEGFDTDEFKKENSESVAKPTKSE